MRNTPDSKARRSWLGALAGAALVATLIAGACGGSPLTKRPDAETFARLAEAERAWRAESEDYPAMRDELRQDPVAVVWLTKMFVREVVRLRGAKTVGFGENMVVQAKNVPAVMQAGADEADRAADARRRLWKRAILELVTLGEDAVPVLIDNLLLDDQVHLRQYGVELLGYVGEPAIPALLDASRSSDDQHRRSAAQALGAVADHAEVFARLREMTKDREFTVRADAARSLRSGGAEARDLLCEIVGGDDDPFVRRSAVKALGGHRDRRAANALIEFLAQSVNDGDWRNVEAAQDALREMAGLRGKQQHSPEMWKEWAAGLPE